MNDYGATGHDCANVLAPSLVPLTGVTDAGTGWRTSCAATAEGVRCFGVAGFGKLGNGSCPGDCFVGQPVPQAVTGLGRPTDLGVFWDHTCALVGQGCGAGDTRVRGQWHRHARALARGPGRGAMVTAPRPTAAVRAPPFPLACAAQPQTRLPGLAQRSFFFVCSSSVKSAKRGPPAGSAALGGAISACRKRETITSRCSSGVVAGGKPSVVWSTSSMARRSERCMKCGVAVSWRWQPAQVFSAKASRTASSTRTGGSSPVRRCATRRREATPRPEAAAADERRAPEHVGREGVLAGQHLIAGLHQVAGQLGDARAERGPEGDQRRRAGNVEVARRLEVDGVLLQAAALRADAELAQLPDLRRRERRLDAEAPLALGDHLVGAQLVERVAVGATGIGVGAGEVGGDLAQLLVEGGAERVLAERVPRSPNQGSALSSRAASTRK